MVLSKTKIALCASLVLSLSAGIAIASNEPKVAAFSSNLVRHYLSGDYAIRQQDTDAASKIFLTAITEEPDNHILLGYGYNLLLSLGEIDNAVELSDKYLKVAPVNSDITILQATQAIKNRDYDKASKMLGLPTKNEPITVSSSINRVIFPFLQQWVKIGQGKNDEALKFINEKLSDSSAPSLFTYYQKALINDIAGDKEEAIKSYSTVSDKDTILPYHFVNSTGNFYERIGQKDTAIEVYNKYRAQYPQSDYFSKNLERIASDVKPESNIPDASYGFAEVLEEAARVLFTSGYYEEGMPYLRLAMYLKPNNDETKVLLASYYEDNNQYKKAVEIYSYIGKDSDFYLSSSIAIAEGLYNYGKKDKALRQLEKLTDVKNPSKAALLTLADMYRKDSKFKEASATYTKVISLIPTPTLKNWPIYFARGICYERSKNWPMAEKDLMKALELKPGQPEVLNYLGYSWIDRNKNMDKARKMVETAVKARPDDPQIIDSMGWALYKINDFDNASLFLERAAELTPYDSTINDHLGDAYWRQGRYNEARFQWHRALRYNNNDELSESDVRNKLENGLPELKNNS